MKYNSVPSDNWKQIAMYVSHPLWVVLMCVCKEANEGVKDLITSFNNNDHRTSGLNYLQARAYCNVCFFRKNTFLTGGAGTGKSYVTRRIIDAIRGSFEGVEHIPGRPKQSSDGTVEAIKIEHARVAACAPTGMASLQICTGHLRALTIHNLFNIRYRTKRDTSKSMVEVHNAEYNDPIDEQNDDEEKAEFGDCEDGGAPFACLDNFVKQRLAALHVLVIDEVSMVSAEMMTLIDLALRAAKGSNNAFGGVTVLAVGDFFQLPPVLKASDIKRCDGKKWAFESPSWSSLKNVELTECVRQGDAEFCQRLNRVRNGTHSNSDIFWLNKHSRKTGDGDIAIYAHKSLVRRRNEAMLARLEDEPTVYIQMHCSLLASSPTSFQRISDLNWPGLTWPKDPVNADPLQLKLGARVQQIRNFYTGEYPNRMLEIANGQTGTITELSKDGVTVCWDPVNGIVKTRPVERMTWRKRQRSEMEQHIKSNLRLNADAKIYTTHWQFPIALCWAKTTHASQGTTATVNVDVNTSGNFPDENGKWRAQYGLAYVAISRATDIKLMRFLTPLKSSHIAVDPMVKQFYDSMSQSD
jgi:ATP-dependent exoDNAse (exonuclease V) alpha subunit